MTPPLYHSHNHYFIELFHDLNPTLSSGAAAGARHARARDFVKTLQGWLDDQLLADEVSALKVTVLGRIMLTCSPELVERLEELDLPDIVAITSPATMPVMLQGSRLAG